MTSPVFQALVTARQQQLNRDERVIAEEVSAVLGPPPPDTHRPERFMRWCEEQSLPWRPASPSVIAKFVLAFNKLGSVMDEIRAISAAHTAIGLPDPCASWQVSEALCRLTKVEPPRSWPAAEKTLFLMLPVELQKYLIPRERDRDATIRRLMSEADLLRKQLAELQPPKETNGTTENAAT